MPILSSQTGVISHNRHVCDTRCPVESHAIHGIFICAICGTSGCSSSKASIHWSPEPCRESSLEELKRATAFRVCRLQMPLLIVTSGTCWFLKMNQDEELISCETLPLPGWNQAKRFESKMLRRASDPSAFTSKPEQIIRWPRRLTRPGVKPWTGFGFTFTTPREGR